MKYSKDQNLWQKRRRRLLSVVSSTLMVLILIVVGYIFYQNLREENRPIDNSISGTTRKITAPNVNTFKTPYFKFQAGDSWREVSDVSSVNKFVYRSYKKNLLEHDLTIYVNEIPDQSNFKSTRVLPVDIIYGDQGGAEFRLDKVSDACTSALNPNILPPDVQNVDFMSVKFLCYGKIGDYNVVIGKKKDGINMKIKRTNGSEAIYTIHYRDLRAVNGPDELISIMQTFRIL